MSRCRPAAGAFLLLGLVTALACESSAPIAPAGKTPGGEESPLDGKDDSFVEPSDHGPLRFGPPNSAEFSDDERFIAYTFTLTGEAELMVRTAPLTANLDTVIYLYRRDAGDASWGQHIAKNDDFGGELFSRLDIDGQAGEYRVIVKAHKLAMRGRFDVLAECSGAGCPSSPVCEPTDVRSRPAETGYGAACAEVLRDLATNPVSSRGGTAVKPSLRCSLAPLEALAADYYIDYWTNEIGFPEMVSEEEGAVLNVETTSLEGGATVVAIDVGADEDGLFFVFDAAGKLELYFHSEQSSTAHFSCAAGGDALPESQWPSEDCTGSALFGFPHDAAHTETGGASITFGDLSAGQGEVPALVAQIALGVLDGQSVADTDVIDLEWTAWGTGHESGARVTLGDATYTATDGFFGDPILVLVERPDGVEALCKRLE